MVGWTWRREPGRGTVSTGVSLVQTPHLHRFAASVLELEDLVVVFCNLFVTKIWDCYSIPLFGLSNSPSDSSTSPVPRIGREICLRFGEGSQ